MNYFNQNDIDKFCPEAECIPGMKIWKLSKGKEDKFSEVCESGNYFVQIKKDGYFYEYEKTENYAYFFSRAVSVKTNLPTEKLSHVPHIANALECIPKGTILIGELYYPGGTSKSVTTVMGCLAEEAIKRQEKNGYLHYYLHDIIKYNGTLLLNTPAEERYSILATLWDEYNLAQCDFLELAEVWDENIQEITNKALADGEEGVVLKKKDAPYSPDKRPAWATIKVKQADTIDAICMGFCDATKEYTGKESLENWNYWITEKQDVNNNWHEVEKTHKPNFTCVAGFRCVPVTKPYWYGWKTAMRIGLYDNDGKLKEIGTVSSGLTDELRQAFAEHPENYIGKVCEIQCMSRDNSAQTVRHPFLKKFREDKNANECLLCEVFDK